MIYTDGIHLIGDSIEELHAFAEKIGLNKCWYRRKKQRGTAIRKPHYDLGASANTQKRLTKIALENGAILKTDKQLIEILKKHSPALY